jgi:hypothetical protein
MLNHRTKLGPKFSEGARLLWLQLEALNITAADVQREIKASSGSASCWLYGDKRPGRTFAQRLEEKFGVPVSAWDQPTTVIFVPPAARVAA